MRDLWWSKCTYDRKWTMNLKQRTYLWWSLCTYDRKWTKKTEDVLWWSLCTNEKKWTMKTEDVPLVEFVYLWQNKLWQQRMHLWWSLCMRQNEQTKTEYMPLVEFTYLFLLEKMNYEHRGCTLMEFMYLWEKMNYENRGCKVGKLTWCLTCTETIRLIRDGHRGCTSSRIYVPCIYSRARWELP